MENSTNNDLAQNQSKPIPSKLELLQTKPVIKLQGKYMSQLAKFKEQNQNQQMGTKDIKPQLDGDLRKEKSPQGNHNSRNGNNFIGSRRKQI